MFGDPVGGRDTGLEQRGDDLLIVHALDFLGAPMPALDETPPQCRHADTAAVVAHHQAQRAIAVRPDFHPHRSLRRFAGAQALFRGLDPVDHGVAHQLGQRLLKKPVEAPGQGRQAGERCLEAHLLVEIAGHALHQAFDLPQYRREGAARRGGFVLAGKLPHLGKHGFDARDLLADGIDRHRHRNEVHPRQVIPRA